MQERTPSRFLLAITTATLTQNFPEFAAFLAFSA
jgi:hypothetical protein